MPYNVITLSGTVFAFFFGSLLRALTRSLRPLRLGQPILSNKPIPRLLRFIARAFDDE